MSILKPKQLNPLKNKNMEVQTQYTVTSPGCFHSMIEYLSEVTGISQKVEKDFPTLESLRDKRNKLMYRSCDISVVKDGVTYPHPKRQTRKGLGEVLVSGGITFPLDTKFDRVYVMVYRYIKDFGIELESAGKYKDCLGGGWHCTVPLYKIGENYFAPNMECAHR